MENEGREGIKKIIEKGEVDMVDMKEWKNVKEKLRERKYKENKSMIE